VILPPPPSSPPLDPASPERRGSAAPSRRRAAPLDAAATRSGDVVPVDAPRVLVTGPPGSGKSRVVLSAFDDALERFGADRVLLVLPTYGEVEHQKRLAVSRPLAARSSLAGMGRALRGAGREQATPLDAPPTPGLARRRDGQRARGVLDVSYATFTSLGERLSPGFLVRDLPSRRERDLLADEALARADVATFRGVRDRPGFRARFLRLVKEMKQGGDEPSLLRERLRGRLDALPSARSRDLFDGFLRAWEAYDALLSERGRLDHEDVLRGLVGAVAHGGGARAGAGGLADVALLVVDGFDDLSGVETALLRAAADAVTERARDPGRVLVTLPWDPARTSVFSRSATLRDALLGRAGFVEAALSGFRRSASPALSALATRLFDASSAPVNASVDGALDDVRSIVASDPTDEVERIGREVLRLRREEPEVASSFRDVGIVVRRLDDVGPSMRRALEALGIPCRLAVGGRRLSSEAVVRALRGPLAVLSGDDGAFGGDGDDHDFDAFLLLDHLRWRALAAGDVSLERVDELDQRWRRRPPPTWADARRELHGSGGTASTFAAALETMRVRARAARGAAAVWSFLADAVLALLPLPPGALLDADGRPLDPEGDARVARARAARTALVELAAEGARLAPLCRRTSDPTVRAAVDDLLAAADDATCEPVDRRIDTVHLLDAEEARHWELPVVFVAGLVERSFPLHPREDVFLRDEDREALAAARPGADASPALRTARAAEDDERRLFLGALTRARRRLYLSRGVTDAGGREVDPSPFVDAVHAALGFSEDDPDRPLEDASRAFRSAPPPREAAAPRDLERWLAARLGELAPDPAERRAALALARTGGSRVASILARACRFVRAEADPLAGTPSPAFAASVESVPPTAIATGLACPHRFFLARVLGLDRDDAPFDGRPFDARLHGRLLHAALAHAAANEAMEPAAVAKAVVAEHARDLPDASAVAFALDDLTRVVTLFREREALARASGFKPDTRRLEAAFDGVALGSGDEAFALEGRVDRVDVDGTGRAIVVDYKSRVAGREKERLEAIASLDDPQLPLYALAVEERFGVEVVGIELYDAKRRGRASLVVDDVAEAAFSRCEGGRVAPVDAESFRALLDAAADRARAVVASVRAGRIDKRPADPAACATCDVRGVCRPDVDRFDDGDAVPGDDSREGGPS
jgi:RecB family exonuclease